MNNRWTSRKKNPSIAHLVCVSRWWNIGYFRQKHCLLQTIFRVFSAAHAFTHRMSHGIKVRIQIIIATKKINIIKHVIKEKQAKEENRKKKKEWKENTKSTVNDRQQQNILTVGNDIFSHICTKSKNNFDYSFRAIPISKTIQQQQQQKHMFITGKRSPHHHIHNYF